MSGIASTTDGANALARILGRFFTTAITDTDPAKNIIAGVEPGYYLVKETTTASEQNPISLNLLKVVGTDVPITTKEDLPSINKLIDEKGGIEANTASIGDVVPYIITSKVPDMTGYNKYFFILNDTLSTGLTYVDNSISITVGGGAPLTAGTDYTFTESSGAIKIVFNDFYGKYNDNVGDAIVVKYNALVNEHADLTQTGNINTAQLTYSNDPNVKSRGENEPTTTTEEEDNPDTPEDETKPDPTGQTPQKKTVTYVTQIDITKKRADGTTPLAGAKFKLEGYKKTVGAAAGKYYVEDEGGTYYRLADGTYTTEEPNGTDTKAYESTNKKYKEVTLDSEEATAEKITLTGESDADGKINFAGLGEGIYTITETEAPTGGYVKLANPITVEIKATEVSLTGCKWDKALTDPNSATTAGDFVQGDKSGTESSLPLTVINKISSTLPETGGIGTKMFYLFGSAFVIGASTFIVTKKRVGENK